MTREDIVLSDVIARDQRDGLEKKRVLTPSDVCEKMISILSPTQEHKILIVDGLEFLHLIKKKIYLLDDVWFSTPSVRRKAFAIAYGVKEEHIIFHEYNSLKNLQTKVKFDAIIANPTVRHMTFLNRAYTMLNDNGTIVFIHPSTYFVSMLGPLKKRSNRVNFPEKEIVSLELMPTTIFGENVAQYVPFSITKVVKGSDNNGIIHTKLENQFGYTKFNGLTKVNVFGDMPEIYSLMDKLEKHDSILSHLIDKEGNYKWFVEISMIRGNNHHTILNKTVTPSQIVSQNFKWQTFGFYTEDEAKNFISYLRTKFARNALHLLKLNQHLDRGEMTLIPWMDFTKVWDDDKLFTLFGLDDKEKSLVNSLESFYE